MRATSRVLLAFLSTSTIVLSQNATPVSPVVQLRQVLDVSKRRGQLEMDGTVPYHLKGSFQLFSNEGKLEDTGTLDELWKDPSHYRLELADSGGDLIEARNDERHWRSGKMPPQNRIMLAVNAALNPFWEMPSGDRLFVEVPPNHDPNLDCIGTEPEIPGVGMEVRLAETTYCMSKGSHLLRSIQRPNGFTLVLNDTQQFGEKKYIPRSIDLPAGANVWIRLHIDSITAADDLSPLEAPPPTDAMMLQGFANPIGMNDPTVPPFQDGFFGQILDAPMRSAPSAAGHGIVVLRLNIGKSGQVVDADVVSSPNPILASFAVSQVKHWRYRVSYRGQDLIANVQTVSLRF